MNRWRAIVVGLSALTVAVGWPLSVKVSALRSDRFSPDLLVASAAQAAFADWHLVSLSLSLIALGLAGVALALTARMPTNDYAAR